MKRPVHRWLLCLLILAVGVAPLQGLLAMPAVHAVTPQAHCAGMQHGMQAAGDRAGDRVDCPRCRKGCDGAHCSVPCAACVLAFVAIDNQVLMTFTSREALSAPRPAERYSDRTSHPPFRPPISRA